METIYGLREVGGDVRYIGRTRRPLRKRLAGHRHKARHPGERSADYPVYQWMRSVGAENVEAVPLAHVAADDASAAELECIALYRGAGADLTNRHTYQRGEGRPAARLTEDDVRQILREGKWATTEEIGRRWGVSGRNIRYILTDKAWTHIERGSL